MTNFIYSTLTCDNTYHAYMEKTNEHQLNHIIKSVTIRGGANLCKVTNNNLSTQHGFVTQVSDEELEFLEKNPCFIEHKKNGFIIVDSNKLDVNQVASSMTKKDKSAPKVPSDYKKHQLKREAGSKTIIMEKKIEENDTIHI